MRIDKERKIIHFEDDAEFENWAVKDHYVIIVNEFGHPCYDVPYTDEYKKALKEDYMFHIKQFFSIIKKHKSVSKGIINKPIKNLM